MRDLIITAFEVVGLSLLAAALGVYLFRFDPALALLGAGTGVLVESTVLALLGSKPSQGDDE